MISESRSPISLNQNLQDFCSHPEDYNLHLKNNILSAEKKIFLISRLKRWFFKEYNFSHILEEFGQKCIAEKSGISRELLLEKIKTKAKKYAQTRRCFFFKREKKIGDLFEKVRDNLLLSPEKQKELKELLKDQELRDILIQYGIETDKGLSAFYDSMSSCIKRLKGSN